jgi:hypothetical protein
VRRDTARERLRIRGKRRAVHLVERSAVVLVWRSRVLVTITGAYWDLINIWRWGHHRRVGYGFHERVRSVGSINRSLVRGRQELWCRPERANFDQIEAERLDLPEDAEQRGSILEQPCKDSLAALQRRR